MNYILVEIFIILFEYKASIPKFVTVACHQSTELIFKSSLPVGSESSKKRKKKAFGFKAWELSIILYAPIETLKKSTSKVTCVPAGKRTKSFLMRFIDIF